MIDHALAGGEDRLVVGDHVARRAAVALLEKLHGEVNALELAPGHRQIARLARAAAEHDRVVLRAELRRLSRRSRRAPRCGR